MKLKDLFSSKKKARFSCRKCGARSHKRGNLCNPKKVKQDE